MKPKQTAIEKLAERIAELEADNAKLKQDPPFVAPNSDDVNAAAQGRIIERKNANDDLVQVTRAGNVRTTRDE